MAEFVFKQGKRYAVGLDAPPFIPHSIIMQALKGPGISLDGKTIALPAGFSDLAIYDEGDAPILNEPTGSHTHVIMGTRTGPDIVIDAPPQVPWVIEVAAGVPAEPGTVDPKHDKTETDYTAAYVALGVAMGLGAAAGAAIGGKGNRALGAGVGAAAGLAAVGVYVAATFEIDLSDQKGGVLGPAPTEPVVYDPPPGPAEIPVPYYPPAPPWLPTWPGGPPLPPEDEENRLPGGPLNPWGGIFG